MNHGQVIPPYKKKIARPRRNKRLSKLLLLFFFSLSIIIYFNSPISKITEIKITGLELLSEKDIFQQGEIEQGEQYLFLSTSNLEQKLLKMNEIKNVKIEKKFPGKLMIDVTENQVIAFFYHSQKEWLPILENGYIIYNNSSRPYINRPLITNWNNEDKIVPLAKELAKVDPLILEELSEIQYNTKELEEERILLFTRDGYTVHVNLKDLGQKLNLLPNVLNELKAKKYPLGEIYLLDSIRFEEYKDSGEVNDES